MLLVVALSSLFHILCLLLSLSSLSPLSAWLLFVLLVVALSSLFHILCLLLSLSSLSPLSAWLLFVLSVIALWSLFQVRSQPVTSPPAPPALLAITAPPSLTAPSTHAPLARIPSRGALLALPALQGGSARPQMGLRTRPAPLGTTLWGTPPAVRSVLLGQPVRWPRRPSWTPVRLERIPSAVSSPAPPALLGKWQDFLCSLCDWDIDSAQYLKTDVQYLKTDVTN